MSDTKGGANIFLPCWFPEWKSRGKFCIQQSNKFKGGFIMSKHEAREELWKVNEAIENHKREWAGMLGTIWEKEDWQAKHERRYECLCVLCGRCA